MAKKTLLIIFLVLGLFLTGCNHEEKGYSYHPTYIEANNGKRWSNYAILYENVHSGINDGTVSILKQGEQTQEYELFFTIDASYYKKGDIILGTSDYVYIFNQDKEKTFRIVGFKLSGEKKSPTIVDDKKIKSIVNVYGADKEYIYIGYFDDNKEKYFKINADLNKMHELDDLESVKDQIEYNVLKNN